MKSLCDSCKNYMIARSVNWKREGCVISNEIEYDQIISDCTHYVQKDSKDGKDGIESYLKPCPFCGGNVKIRKEYNNSAYWIECINNHDFCPIIETVHYGDKDELIRDWNNRKDDKESR